MKIRSVGTELFYADRHGRANTRSRFSQFCESAKNVEKYFYSTYVSPWLG
jgi:hypothetical protein